MFNLGKKYKLSEIVDIKFLQEYQEILAKITNISFLSFDLTKSITKPTNYFDFCLKYHRSTLKGIRECDKSDLGMGDLALEKKEPVIVKCHRGLTIFAVPIIIEGEAYGTIGGGQVFTEEPDENLFRQFARDNNFDEDEYIAEMKKIPVIPEKELQNIVDLLSLVGNAISEIGYRNLKIIEKSKKEDFYIKILETIRSTIDIKELEKTIVEVIAKTFDADRCFILSYDQDKSRYIKDFYEYLSSDRILSYKEHNFPEETPNFARAFQNGQPVIVNNKKIFINGEDYDFTLESRAIDYFQVKSAFAYPLYYFKEYLGVLVVHYVEKEHYISDDEISMIALISNQLTFALHQALLYSKVKLQAEREKISKNIVEILRSTLDKNTIVHLFVQNIGKYFEADNVFFSVFDAKNKKYLPVVKEAEYLSNSDKYSYVGYDWSDSKLRKLMEPLLAKREVLLPDVDRYFKENPNNEEFKFIFDFGGLKSSYNLPVLYDGNILGAFSIGFADKIKEFSEEELNRIRHISYQASMAIYHSDLYVKAQEAAKIKGDFITDITNQLSVILDNIIGFSESLFEKKVPDQEDNCINFVQANTQELLDFRNNVMLFADIESEKYQLADEEVDTKPLIEQAYKAIERIISDKNIKIDYVLSDIKLNTDENLFKRILYNILKELAGYTPNNGYMKITSKVADNHLIILIEDFGLDFDTDIKNKIFKIFKEIDFSYQGYRSDKKILGLDLAKKLVELIDGKIYVDSTEDNGTSIELIFPIED